MRQRHFDGLFARVYPGGERRLYVKEAGIMTYKYWRELDPHAFGATAAIATGAVKVGCEQAEFHAAWRALRKRAD